MASLAQVDLRSADNRDRIILLEALIAQILDNTVVFPNDWMEINSAADKTGKYCYGKKAGINDGALIVGWKSTVANPTSNADFETPYGLAQ